MSKRSVCLHAGIAAAWLALTSHALAGQADPPVDPAAAAPPAQPDPNAPPPPSSSEPAPPPPPSSVIVGPSVTMSVPPPGVDTPNSSGAETAKKLTIRHFEGSSLFNQNSMTTSTVFRGQQLYDDPTVESSLYILPRYAINEAFQLRGRVVVSYEYTNSDTTTYRNEPLLSDTSIALYYRKIPKLVGFQPYVAASLSLPTSLVSRSRTLVASPGVLVQVSRAFEHFLHGEALILGNLGYAHPFYQSKNPETVDPRPPGAFSCVGGTNCQDLLSGTMNPSDTLSYSIILEADWGRWSPAIMYLGASQWAYHPPAAINPVDGTPITAPSGFEPTSVRQTHYFSTWVDYNFNPWFTGEIGFWNSVQAINGAGERSNIFFDRYQDTRVYLGCSIQLDNLAKALAGESEGAGGVVRANNHHQPMWNF